MYFIVNVDNIMFNWLISWVCVCVRVCVRAHLVFCRFNVSLACSRKTVWWLQTNLCSLIICVSVCFHKHSFLLHHWTAVQSMWISFCPHWTSVNIDSPVQWPLTSPHHTGNHIQCVHVFTDELMRQTRRGFFCTSAISWEKSDFYSCL